MTKNVWLAGTRHPSGASADQPLERDPMIQAVAPDANASGGGMPVSNTSMSDDDPLPVLVEFIAMESGMAERILTTHVSTVYGECRACSGQLRRTRWPCFLHHCAQQAQALEVKRVEDQWNTQPTTLGRRPVPSPNCCPAKRAEVIMNICSKAPPGAGCGRELRPPPGDPTYYQPAIESEPGPMVTALAPIGISAHLMYYARIVGGWTIKGLLIPDDTRVQGGSVILGWSELGRCWADRPHPVRAVHFDRVSLCWMPGVVPGSVRDQSRLLAQRWWEPHRWHRGQDES